jgi:hypothetical protein
MSENSVPQVEEIEAMFVQCAHGMTSSDVYLWPDWNCGTICKDVNGHVPRDDIIELIEKFRPN